MLFGFAALVLLALGVPIAASIYWMFEGSSSAVTGLTGTSLLDAGLHTALYSALAAALATVFALPVAILAVRHPTRFSQFLERSTYLVLAMPGVVIAFALGYFSERYANGFAYQTTPMLVLAYAVLFFPLALVGVRSSRCVLPGQVRGGGTFPRTAARCGVREGDPPSGRARASLPRSAWSSSQP